MFVPSDVIHLCVMEIDLDFSVGVTEGAEAPAFLDEELVDVAEGDDMLVCSAWHGSLGRGGGLIALVKGREGPAVVDWGVHQGRGPHSLQWALTSEKEGSQHSVHTLIDRGQMVLRGPLTGRRLPNGACLSLQRGRGARSEE